jgi:hypothetical protein
MRALTFESSQTVTQREFAAWARVLETRDRNRYELLNGRVVLEPPAGWPHGEAEVDVAVALATFVKARRLGKVFGSSQGFELPSGDTVDVVIRLAVDAVPLAPLEVIARATPIHRNPGLAGFYRRVERSIGGRFVLRDEIETRNQRRVTDLLITTGVSVIGVPEGGYRGLFMKRSNCAPMVYLDGAPLMRTGDAMSRPTAAYEAANVLTPFDVEGIEVYPGPASVPSEFGGPTAGCSP